MNMMIPMNQMGGSLGSSAGQVFKAVVVSKATEYFFDAALEKNGDDPVALLSMVTKENVGRLEVAGAVAAFGAGQTTGWASMGLEITSEAAAIATGAMRSLIKMEERAKAAQAAKSSNKEGV